MTDTATPKTELNGWTLSQAAFRKLLTWFDEDTDSSGERYEEMRRRLVSYFDRKNCRFPDELADETLNRVARRLEEEGSIETDAPAHYCYIVARFVLQESFRAQQRHESLDARFPLHSEVKAAAATTGSEDREEREKRWECLDRCVRRLERENRALIIGYYQGEHRAKLDNRRALAAKMGITMNALSIRACRIRDRLETCMRQCLGWE